jgi:RNA polymerase sigma-B factor
MEPGRDRRDPGRMTAAAPRDGTDLEALVARYRPLALRLARRYLRSGEQPDDLEQVACLGLVNAARRFDPARGTAFSTFAVPTILGELRRHCRDTRWSAHVPRPVQERVQASRRLQDAFLARHGRTPTVSEAAERLGCSDEEVLDARVAAGCLAPASLNAAIESSDGEFAEALDAVGADERGYEEAERRQLLEAALGALPARTRLALYLRFEHELTMPEIGRRLGISASQAGRIVQDALRTLRDALEERPAVAPAPRTRQAFERGRRPPLLAA